MNKNSYKKLTRLLSNFDSVVEDKAQKIEYSYIQKGKKDINQIARNVIDEFYESYDPIYYADDRWGDLYNAYKVTVNNKVWKIEYGAQFMKYRHRASNEYIFELAFEWGYHGGAWNGPNHPEPGVPYYRKYPFYKQWSRPATFASFSPYRSIEEKVEKYFDNVDVSMNEEFKQSVLPYLEEIANQIKKTFNM